MSSMPRSRARSILTAMTVLIAGAAGSFSRSTACAGPAGGALTIPGGVSADPAALRWEVRDGYDRPTLPGFITGGAFGFPALPERAAYFSIPTGYRVSRLTIDHAEHEPLSQVRRLPTLLPPASESGPSAIAARTDEYPGRPVELGPPACWRGEEMVPVIYHPLGVIPRTGELVFYPNVTFSLFLEPEDPGARRAVTALRAAAPSAPAGFDEALGLVQNPPLPASLSMPIAGSATAIPFRPTEYPSLDGSLVEYVVITTDSLAGAWQSWADWKTACGVPAVVRTTSTITAGYPNGVDLADRIRRFIREAYQKWGTTDVLIGGDPGVVPIRYAHMNYGIYPGGEDFPTDLYYGCLDGTWDGDGDGVFGEGYDPGTGAPGDSVDLYPEVHVGRAPVATAADVATFINKSRGYRTTPVAQNQLRVAFLAEVLWPAGWQYPDTNDITMNGCDLADSCMAEFHPPWSTSRLCQWPDQDLSFSAVRDTLNRGFGFVTMLSHGDPFKVPTGDRNYFRSRDMAALNNYNKFSIFLFSSAATGQLDSDCIQRTALLNPVGGAVAAIAPSRFNYQDLWAARLQVFYSLLCRGGSDALGELNDLEMIPFAGVAGEEGEARWVYLTSVFLGDPDLRVWRSLPDAMTLVHAGGMSLADSSYALAVLHAGAPVPGATATLWDPATGDYARGETDAAGAIVFAFRPVAAGAVNLTVTHPLYKTRSGTVVVNSSGAARLEIARVSFDDDSTGASSGNGDGIPDAGERIELGITLQNSGTVPVSAAGARLDVAPGAQASINVLQNGQSQPGRFFIGAGRAHPASLPVTIALGDGTPSPWGRPDFTAGAPADTGAWFWQDVAGWHLRLLGAPPAPMSFTGSLVTDGRILAASRHEMESADELSVSGSMVNFSAAMDSTDWEDGFDLVLADSAFARAVVDTVSAGSLAPGDSVTRVFVVDVADSAADQHQARFGVTLSGDAPAPKTWSEGLRMATGAPVLAEEFHAIDDSTDGGNRNGRIDIGETVRLSSVVRNLGHGHAAGVTGVLRAVSGVTVLDSVVAYGDIAGGNSAAGGTYYRLHATGLPRSVTLELRDVLGRRRSHLVELGVPGAPSALSGDDVLAESETGIDLSWAAPADSDLAGYNVYRAPGGGGSFSRVNAALVTGSAFFHDPVVNADSTYRYRVAAVDSAGNEGPRSAAVTATPPPPYQASFPRTTQGTIWSSPLCADVDGDGKLRGVRRVRRWESLRLQRRRVRESRMAEASRGRGVGVPRRREPRWRLTAGDRGRLQ